MNRKQAIRKIVEKYVGDPYGVSQDQVVEALDLLAEGAHPVDVINAIEYIARGVQMLCHLECEIQRDQADHRAQVEAQVADK